MAAIYIFGRTHFFRKYGSAFIRAALEDTGAEVTFVEAC